MDPLPDIHSLRSGHPRILAGENEFQRIREADWDDLGMEFLRRFRQNSKALLSEPPFRFERQGKRILHISREVLQRITSWALLYRVDGDPDYRERILAELDAVCAFPTWNPAHFLDVGEMALAVSIGLDWLWDEIPSEKRESIIDTLWSYALEPSLAEDHHNNWWITYQNNWNPVCHTGLIAAAIHYADRDPQQAEYIIRRAVQNLPTSQDETNPDGVYPEGPTYWNYGTSFTALAINLLQHAFGSDFGLLKHPGFRKSVEFRAFSMGPTGEFYNFFDSTIANTSFVPVLAFFASVYRNPVAHFELQRSLKEFLDLDAEIEGFNIGRQLPWLALWYPQELISLDAIELPRTWLGRGENPVAYARESFQDPHSTFLAFKGGNARISHAHMDAGSFIFEDQGVRWAIDLGAQNYLSLESEGVGLWDRRQVGDRWRIFRLGPYSHNLLLVEDQLHKVDAQADITQFEDMDDFIKGVVDCTDLFPGLVDSYQRKFLLHGMKVLQVTDHLTGLFIGGGHEARYNSGLHWRMLTRADVEIEESSAILRQDGKTLYLKIVNPESLGFFVFRSQPVDPPPNYFDEPNPGVQAIDLYLRGDNQGNRTLTVLMSTDLKALAKVEANL